MKRLGIMWGALLLIVASTAPAWSLHGATAQDNEAEATISALQTEVAALQDQLATSITATPADITAPETASPPVDGTGSPFLGGEAAALLIGEQPSGLEVITTGTYDGRQLPVVVQNGTDEGLMRISVSAVARDAAGTLLAAGGDRGFLPNRLQPGDLAIGYISFDRVALPTDATFEFEVSGDPLGEQLLGRLDLAVDEATLLDNRVVGILSNPHDETVNGPISLSLACFTEDGHLLSFHTGYTDKDTAVPGDTVPFQITLRGDTICPVFLLAASGWDF